MCSKEVLSFNPRQRESVWESRPTHSYVLASSFPMEDSACVFHKNSFVFYLQSYSIHMRIKKICNCTGICKSGTFSFWCFMSPFKLYIQAVNFTIILMNLGKKGDVVFCNALVPALKIWVIWYFVNSKIDITLPQVSLLNWLAYPDNLPKLSWEYKLWIHIKVFLKWDE